MNKDGPADERASEHDGVSEDAPLDESVGTPTPPPRRRRFLRGLKFAALGAVVTLLVGLVTMRLALHATPGVGKNPPAGYRSTDMLVLAYTTGQLDMIDMELPLPDSVELREGVEYGRGGDVPLKLDLYLPKNIEQPAPAVIFIHGGGWEAGQRQDYRYYCIKFAERGYVAATISYRLKDVALFPAAIEDAKCAVRWMRANAESLGADPNRIAVAGGSAGGHLSMMVGYSSEDASLEGDGGNAGVSSRPQAVVDLYGPADLTTPYGRTHRTVTTYLGKSFDEAPELYEQGSPLYRISADDPPTLIFHGSIDDLVPITQSDRLAQALEEFGVEHEYHPLEGWPHTMDVVQVVNDFCMARMFEFLEKHLAEDATAPATSEPLPQP